MDEQDVCVSRLGSADQRERISSHRSVTRDRGKPGRIETEVQRPKSAGLKNGQVTSLIMCQCFKFTRLHVSCVQILSEEVVVGGPRWVSQWATLAASHIRTDPEGSGGESHTVLTEDRGTHVRCLEKAKALDSETNTPFTRAPLTHTHIGCSSSSTHSV